jgi:hypothetical protein
VFKNTANYIYLGKRILIFSFTDFLRTFWVGVGGKRDELTFIQSDATLSLLLLIIHLVHIPCYKDSTLKDDVNICIDST